MWAQGASLQGTTGLLETPTAEVLQAGRISAYVGRRESGALTQNFQTYGFTLGLWPDLELGGRIVEADRTQSGRSVRDLSGDIKWRLFNGGGFSFAVGAQDFAGEAQNFRSRYLVATQQVGPLSLSAGYGDDLDRLDGAFGGVELSLGSHLDVMLDHDAETSHGGFRLNLGRADGWQVQLLGSQRLQGDPDWSGKLALSRPLGARSAVPASAAKKTRVLAVAGAQPQWALVRTRLLDAGLDSIRLMETAPGTVRVVFAARRFSHSDLDGLGVALGVLARDLPESIQQIQLVLLKDQLPVLFLSVPRAELVAWLGGEIGLAELRASGLTIRYASRHDLQSTGTVRAASAQPEYRLLFGLEPQLRSFVATEMGVLDVDLGVRGRIGVPLGQGTRLNISAIAPLYRSDDFRNPDTFGGQRVDGGIDQALLQHVLQPTVGWTSHLAAGLMRVQNLDTAALLHEQMLTNADGRLQLRIFGGYFFNRDESRSIGLAELNTLFPASQLSLKLAAGRFIAGDNGVRAELSRFFGDTAVHIFWRAESRVDQAGGLGFSLPFGGRRSAALGSAVIAGDPAWSHRISTTINAADQRNPLRPDLLREDRPHWNIEQDWYDRGRMAPAWVLAQFDRARDAAWRYAR